MLSFSCFNILFVHGSMRTKNVRSKFIESKLNSIRFGWSPINRYLEAENEIV